MVENDDGGILSAEQVVELRKKYPTPKTLEERREAARLRKKAQRTREKKKAEIKAAISQAQTILEFWAESLKTADPTKLAEWSARQEQVEAQLGAMRDCMEGRAFDDEFVEDVDRDTNDMLREYGEVAATPILLIGKFWQDDPELLAKLTSGDTPSAVFAKFGFLLAIDDYSLHKWEQFLSAQATETATAQPNSNGFTTLSCKCGTQPDSVPQSIADRYHELGQEYFCPRCRDLERKSRAESTIVLRGPWRL